MGSVCLRQVAAGRGFELARDAPFLHSHDARGAWRGLRHDLLSLAYLGREVTLISLSGGERFRQFWPAATVLPLEGRACYLYAHVPSCSECDIEEIVEDYEFELGSLVAGSIPPTRRRRIADLGDLITASTLHHLETAEEFVMCRADGEIVLWNCPRLDDNTLAKELAKLCANRRFSLTVENNE